MSCFSDKKLPTYTFCRCDDCKNLERYLPSGGIWNAFHNSDTNASKLLEPFEEYYKDFLDLVCTLAIESDPKQTTLLISDWEKSVGLPDECSALAETIEERRADVLARLCGSFLVNEDDWINAAAAAGEDIEIEYSSCNNNSKEKTPYIIVHFPNVEPNPLCDPCLPCDENGNIACDENGNIECVLCPPVYDNFIPCGDDGKILCDENGNIECKFCTNHEYIENLNSNPECIDLSGTNIECLFRKYKPITQKVFFSYGTEKPNCCDYI